MKEIKDDTNRWKDLQCSWIGRINIVKMTILPKTIYRFSAVSIKLPEAFFTELEQKQILTCMEKTKRPLLAKTILKKNRGKRIMLPEFRIYSKATIIKTVQYWHKNGQSHQWNRTDSPEATPALTAN